MNEKTGRITLKCRYDDDMSLVEMKLLEVFVSVAKDGYSEGVLVLDCGNSQSIEITMSRQNAKDKWIDIVMVSFDKNGDDIKLYDGMKSIHSIEQDTTAQLNTLLLSAYRHLAIERGVK